MTPWRWLKAMEIALNDREAVLFKTALGRSETAPEAIRDLYQTVLPIVPEGTALAALRAHIQACGLLAYMLDMSPDEVAQAVAAA